MTTLFPYVVEYEAEAEFGGGVVHNSTQRLSEPGARDLFALLRESRRVIWARWYKVGEAGDRAEYWRPDDPMDTDTTDTSELRRAERRPPSSPPSC